MDPERWQKIEAAFHAALECPAGRREAFLHDLCGGDAELAAEVESLLAHDDSQASFIERPAVEVLAQRTPRQSRSDARDTDNATLLVETPSIGRHEGDVLHTGQVVQNYRVLQKIGAGGMGEVYLAEDLRLGRRVALKVLPSGVEAGVEASRRFEREARAASALNHPHIVTIYTIDEHAGLHFIGMEYIEGETLKDRLARGPLELEDVIRLGLEVADAIGAAHGIGIIHRDLKPGNILLTATGQAKIVDFGLAKFGGTSPGPDGGDLSAAVVTSGGLSQSGSISGTAAYMSPEQTRGAALDFRSDLYSLGCVLYEAATGSRAAAGDTIAEVIHNVRLVEPPRPGSIRRGLPRTFDLLIRRLLAKDPGQRYNSADEVAADLRRLRSRLGVHRFVRRAWLPAAAGLVVLALIAGWLSVERARTRWASENLPRVETLLNDNRFFEAYDLAQSIEMRLPDDPDLARLKPWITDELTVTTEPPGARVFLRRYQKDDSGSFPPRQLIGTTPLEGIEIARGDYVLTVEKEGYVPFRRTISSALGRIENGLWIPGALRHAELARTPSGSFEFKADAHAPIVVHLKLVEASLAPDRMVFVPGGEYQLAGWDRPTDESIVLSDYFIDLYEVTNREFREFVEAGGYDDRRYWKHPIVKGGIELPWEQAMAELKDPGRNGPASWPARGFPQHKENHPVTNVTWYEAAAYAEFRGKQLPSVYQWEKAARDGQRTVMWSSVMPWGLTGLHEDLRDRANVMSVRSGRGTLPVGSFEFGISPYGCYDMAGNVVEWCRNPRPEGFTTAASSWHDGPNLFGAFGEYPGFYNSETLGFRCALAASRSGDEGAMLLPDKDTEPEFAPLSEETFRLMRSHYEYDRPRPADATVEGRFDPQRLATLLQADLDARIVEEVETDDWRRLKVSFVGAERQKVSGPVPENRRALAYLWLPKHAQPPYQVINYKPGGASYQGVMVWQETEVVCGPFLYGGRAVFVTVVEGMRDRELPPNWIEPEPGSVAYREMMVYDTIDQRRGLDYLETRDDIDRDRCVCMGLSQGGYDLVTMAVEERFQGVLLLSAGIGSTVPKTIAEANAVNFAPYIRGPKLMIHGRYDESLPFRTRALPLFHLLSEPKELIVLDTGHFPPMDQWVPPAIQWLDRVLGPVNSVGSAGEHRL